MSLRRHVPGFKGTMRFCPTWLWLKLPLGYERLWAELAARERPDEAYTRLPSGPELFEATGISKLVQDKVLQALQDVGALEIHVGDAKNRLGWHYRVFYDPPATREEDKRPPESPPAKRPKKEPRDRLGELNRMLLGCWKGVYQEETGIEYVISGADKTALKTIREVAKTRNWRSESARAFFRLAIRYLGEQDYWQGRLTLAVVAFKANEILQRQLRRRPPDPMEKTATAVAERMREVDPAAFDAQMRRYEGDPMGGNGPTGADPGGGK